MSVVAHWQLLDGAIWESQIFQAAKWGVSKKISPYYSRAH